MSEFGLRNIKRQEEPKHSLVLMFVVFILFVLFCSLVIWYSYNYPLPSYHAAINKNQRLLDNLLDCEFSKQVKLLASNNAKISPDSYLTLDKQWRNGDKGLISTVKNSKLSSILLDFQTRNPQFVELFVTDPYGLNLGMTNVTTDFLQSDEDWWKKTFHGENAFVVDKIEFDDSSKNWVLPIYMQVQDQKGQSIGVLKALCASSGVF